MRIIGFAALAILASISTPAGAYDYPWCAQGRGPGYPGDCMYQTRQQCLASADGRGLACNINPRAALNQQSDGRRSRQRPESFR